MTQEEARRLIIAKWRRLPKEQRQTENDAAAFAMKCTYDETVNGFRCSGDKYQRIEGWLFRDLDATTPRDR